MMFKCPHGVYSPDAKVDGEPSYYCSGCYPPEESDFTFKMAKVPFSPFPHNDKRCPVCEEKKAFRFVSEEDWNCMVCGASSNDI
jgi:rubrerythrin